jgi:hypothetical protein
VLAQKVERGKARVRALESDAATHKTQLKARLCVCLCIYLCVSRSVCQSLYLCSLSDCRSSLSCFSAHIFFVCPVWL